MSAPELLYKRLNLNSDWVHHSQILSNTLACENIYWYWGYETENWVRRCRSTKDFGSNSLAVLRESVLGYNKNIWNPMQSAILDAICRLLMTVGKRYNEQLSHENLIVLLDYFFRFCRCLWRKIMGALRSVCNLQGFSFFFFFSQCGTQNVFLWKRS